MDNFLLLMKKNWKSTTLGLVSGAAVLITTSPDIFGGRDAAIVQAAHVFLALGIGGIGVVAQDAKRPPVE